MQQGYMPPSYEDTDKKKRKQKTLILIILSVIIIIASIVIFIAAQKATEEKKQEAVTATYSTIDLDKFISVYNSFALFLATQYGNSNTPSMIEKNTDLLYGIEIDTLTARRLGTQETLITNELAISLKTKTNAVTGVLKVLFIRDEGEKSYAEKKLACIMTAFQVTSTPIEAMRIIADKKMLNDYTGKGGFELNNIKFSYEYKQNLGVVYLRADAK